MLESIIDHSYVRNANRLDAEYFQPKFLEPLNKLERGKYKKLYELCEFVHTGPAGSAFTTAKYLTSGIKVYRPINLNGWNCDDTGAVAISKEYCRKKHLRLYRSGDILITRIGDIKFGIIEEDNVVISPNIIALRVKKELLDPFFLLAFLHTKFGFLQIQRGKKIVSLASVGIGQIANMFIPDISLEKQARIGKVVRKGLNNIKLSKLLYSETEKRLMQTIGFDEIEEHKYSALINLKELKEKQRADAQYFLQQNQNKILTVKTVIIEELAKISRGIEPGRKVYKKSGKMFLRVSNISRYGLLDKSKKFLCPKLFEKLGKKYQPRCGEVLLVKDGKPGVAYAVKKPIEGIISGGIVRLKLNSSFAPEYISLCVNSPFCQQQIQTNSDGTLMPHLKMEQIKKLRIPVVALKKRENFENNIKKSLDLFLEGNNDLIRAARRTEVIIDNL